MNPEPNQTTELAPQSGRGDLALSYARRGFLVLALQPRSKVPLRQVCPHGVKDATADEDTIRFWWTLEPDANIGIATGARSSLLVLDIDPDHGGEESLIGLEDKCGRLPDTVQSLTGGYGRQLFFRYPCGEQIGNSSGKLGPGLDTRGEGGYVVAPGSVHPNGRRYEWEVSHHPDDIPLAVPPPGLLALLSGNAPGSGVTPAPEAEIREGQRNDALFRTACAMRRRDMGEAAIMAALLEDNRARCRPPLPEPEVQGIAARAARYPAGEGSTSASGRPDAGGPACGEAAATKCVAGSQHGADPGTQARTIPVGSGRWPAPLAAAAFHGLAGDIVRAIEPHTEADPAALLLQLLVGFGNIVGRGPHFVAEADRHALNLFGVLVGETAKGRKGTSWGHVQRLLQATDPVWAAERVQSGLSSGEGLIWNVRDPVQSEPGDQGISDKRLLALESEFASTLRNLGRQGNILSPIVRQAWDGGNLRVLTKNFPAKATGAHISIIGHITQQELLRYLTSTEAANGFANRFLFACTRRSRVLPEGGRIDAFDLAALAHRLKEAQQFGRQGGEIKRDEAARALWWKVYPALSEGEPGMVGSVLSRAEAQVMRLACLYAVLDCSPSITADHLQAALAVWGYCEASVRWVFGERLGDPLADELLRFLRNSPQGPTRTEIRDLFSRNKPSAEIDAALALLQQRGIAQRVDEQTGGRPIERWFAGEEVA